MTDKELLHDVTKVKNPKEVKFLLERKLVDRTVKYIVSEVKECIEVPIKIKLKNRQSYKKKICLEYIFDNRPPISTTYIKQENGELWVQEFRYSLPNGFYILVDDIEKMSRIVKLDINKTSSEIDRLSRLTAKLDYYKEEFILKYPQFFV
jgi:hypothetical protein